MKLYEINSLKPIEIEIDGSTAEGYAVNSSAEQLDNWLSRNGYDPSLANKIRQQFKTIAFLNNIYVDEDSRGQGIGNDLLTQFVDAARDENVDAIFLCADTGDQQLPGFDLVVWYESFGFEKVTNDDYPLMILNFQG